MKYFAGCKTLAEVKAKFHELVKKNHPDVGGDTATMQEINRQYKEAVEHIAKYGEGFDQASASAEIPEDYIAAVSVAVACEGLEVELVGSWVWVSGNTMLHKEALKAAGYR